MTEGMRLLIDGLQLFADYAQANGQSDDSIHSALENVRRRAAAVDWNQRLTTFYGSRPDSPSLSQVVLTNAPEADSLIVDFT